MSLVPPVGYDPTLPKLVWQPPRVVAGSPRHLKEQLWPVALPDGSMGSGKSLPLGSRSPAPRAGWNDLRSTEPHQDNPTQSKSGSAESGGLTDRSHGRSRPNTAVTVLSPAGIGPVGPRRMDGPSGRAVSHRPIEQTYRVGQGCYQERW